MATSYAHEKSTGNRIEKVWMYCSQEWSTWIENLLNGDTAANACSAQNRSGRHITFDFFGLYIMDEAKFYQSNTSSHGTWQWQGSNDYSTWTDIGGTFTLGGVATQTFTTLAGNTTPYRWYRLQNVAGNTSTSPYWREFEFKLEEVSVLTGYNDPCSKGNRTGLMTVTSNVSLASGSWAELIDGPDLTAIDATGGESGCYIAFDFLVPKVLKEMMINGHSGYTISPSHGTWKWQGSHDGSSWADLSSNFDFGAADGQNFIFRGLKDNVTSYRYYRMLQVAGLTNANFEHAFADFLFGEEAVPTAPTVTVDNVGFTSVGATTSAFEDINEDDSHAATEFRVRLPDNSYVTSPTLGAVLSYDFPASSLPIGTLLYISARHQADDGSWSDWGVETSFTTASLTMSAQALVGGRALIILASSGAINHELYQDGVLIESWAGALPATYTVEGLGAETSYCFTLKATAWTEEYTTPQDCVTSAMIISLPICTGIEGWGSLVNYMEEDWAAAAYQWYCVLLGCEGIALRGDNIAATGQIGTFLVKYLPHATADVDGYTSIPLDRASSQRVTANISFSQKGWMFHPWLHNEGSAVGIIALGSSDQGGKYGVVALIRMGIMNQNLYFNRDWVNHVCPDPAGWGPISLELFVIAPYHTQARYVDLNQLQQARKVTYQCNPCDDEYVGMEHELVVDQLLAVDPTGKTYEITYLFNGVERFSETFVMNNSIPCGFGGYALSGTWLGDMLSQSLEIEQLDVCVEDEIIIPSVELRDIEVVLHASILCGNLTIWFEYLPDGAGEFASADLEIRRLSDNTLLYSDYGAVVQAWQFEEDHHSLPYNEDLLIRVRARDGLETVTVSQWAEVEPGYLYFCLNIPPSVGVRRILFGEVGPDTPPLATEDSHKRRIIFGEPPQGDS